MRTLAAGRYPAKVHFGDYSDPATTLAEGIVNSYRPSRDLDRLDRSRLADLLRQRGWTGPKPTGRDVERVRELRPRLRAAFEAPDVHSCAAVLNDLLRAAGAVPQLVQHGPTGWHVHPVHAAMDLWSRTAAIAAYGLLAVVQREGNADRLRTCAGPRCGEVFVDLSRNRTRSYCSPAICGNRAHAAARRARARHAADRLKITSAVSGPAVADQG
jgi:predicted RNA-binding Zn ribbon-like protein